MLQKFSDRKAVLAQTKARQAETISATGLDGISNPQLDRLRNRLRNLAHQGKIIPIISSAVRYNHIFDIDADGNVGLARGAVKVANAADKSIEEEMAAIWAESIGYPLRNRDKKQLARVAQYRRVKSLLDPDEAKIDYLNYLKKQLVKLALNDQVVAPYLNELVSLENVDAPDIDAALEVQLESFTFSHIAHDLGYPRYENPADDPLRTLARLPIPVFITTNYHSFLERALQGQGKKPKTQICFWTGEPMDLKPEHKFDPDFVPTHEQPLVYHLYGFEDYPKTLVISEDDYLDYLIEFSRVNSDQISDRSGSNHFFPPLLKGYLASSSLLLLGYRLQNWDFRILFRGILNKIESGNRPLSVAIQFNPDDQTDIGDKKAAREYLENYFSDTKFAVFWDATDAFIRSLR